MLTTGIVGLPNVGKSTLFNALTAGHAAVSNYPFTTIDSNVGMAVVPDSRLQQLASKLQPRECTPCAIEFFDIAGLVEGASQGEGLGNQFLGAIRSVDALVHVLRCFGGTDVAHVLAAVDPVRDARLVETELLLADLEVLEKTIARRERAWKADPKQFVHEREKLERYREALAAGSPLRSLALDREERRELKSLGLLSGKPTIYVANIDESNCGGPEPSAVAAIRSLGAWPGSDLPATVVPISAKIEWELGQLEPEEREEFMRDLGLEVRGLDRLVTAAFDELGLIRFYTLANQKLRAWEVERDTLAPQAAGKVHTDMESGFARAQVASYDDVVAHGGFSELHHLGKLRTEGKAYEVRDGDVIEFLFSS
jgi:GTP-binding protein YchF